MVIEYLIWSIEHGAWWRAGEMGYTLIVDEAGRYSQVDAMRILRRANEHLPPGVANECLIPVACVVPGLRCPACYAPQPCSSTVCEHPGSPVAFRSRRA